MHPTKQTTKSAMSTSADRNAEIWSTRLQREILALESTDDDSKRLELLPPFITTLGHTLNIEGGIAKIEFRIDVEVDESREVMDEARYSAKEGADATEAEGKGEKGAETDDTQSTPAVTTTDPHVILVLDASMHWKSPGGEQAKHPPQYYPFQKPLAVIKSGSELFSGGSTIENGNEIDIDLDWTPR